MFADAENYVDAGQSCITRLSVKEYYCKLLDKTECQLKKEPNKKCRDKYMYFAIETFSDKDDEDI